MNYGNDPCTFCGQYECAGECLEETDARQAREDMEERDDRIRGDIAMRRFFAETVDIRMERARQFIASLPHTTPEGEQS